MGTGVVPVGGLRVAGHGRSGVGLPGWSGGPGPAGRFGTLQQGLGEPGFLPEASEAPAGVCRRACRATAEVGFRKGLTDVFRGGEMGVSLQPT